MEPHDLGVVLYRLDTLDKSIADLKRTIDHLAFVPISRYEAELAASRDREKVLARDVANADAKSVALEERMRVWVRLAVASLILPVAVSLIVLFVARGGT